MCLLVSMVTDGPITRSDVIAANRIGCDARPLRRNVGVTAGGGLRTITLRVVSAVKHTHTHLDEVCVCVCVCVCGVFTVMINLSIIKLCCVGFLEFEGIGPGKSLNCLKDE